MTDRFDDVTWAIAKIKGDDTFHDAIANLLRKKFPEAGWMNGEPTANGRYAVISQGGLLHSGRWDGGKLIGHAIHLTGREIAMHHALPPDPPATVTVDAEYVRHAEECAEEVRRLDKHYVSSSPVSVKSADYILAAKKGGGA